MDLTQRSRKENPHPEQMQKFIRKLSKATAIGLFGNRQLDRACAFASFLIN
jgi:hypothetical protein